jgi:hypothetical protein
VSMTLDTYFSRKQASPKVAELLRVIGQEAS